MRDDIIKIVKELVTYPNEEEWFEFKGNWYQTDGIGEYISSLSNAAAMKGRSEGYLIWGVNNTTHEFTECRIDDKGVIVLVIPAANTTPTAYKGVRYLRIGSNKVNLMKHPKREAALFRILNYGFPPIVNMESEYQDMTFEQLFVYYGVKGNTLNERTFKKNLELLTKDGKYNPLARFLSDNPHIPIRFSLFNGKSKGSTMYAVREFGNMRLLMALDHVLDYGEVLNVPQVDERNRVVERKEVMLFDMDAYREAIINAFVHNLWVTGNEPMFTVYED